MPPKRECPDGERWCPDCARERSGPGCTPLDEWNAGQSYCKRHQMARSNAWRSNLPEEVARERRRAADRAYRERHKDDRREYTNAWKKRNPMKVAAWYSAWAERNPERRRRSQDAYRARHRVRPSPPAPPYVDPQIRRELAEHERELRRDD